MKDSKNKAIIVLTIILIILILGGLVADARYQTMLTGTGRASIANWSFKIIDADPQTTDTIELAVTRTDGSNKVVEGKMAPGTYGEFEVGIDARGTETVVEYTIDISLENAPRNLVFYADSEKTEALEIANSIVTKTGYMALEEVNEIRTEKIYWEWPYETGETDDEKIANNLEDTEDAGKDVTMEITVTGTQVLEEPVKPQTLADVVAVGDYVNYDASSNGVKTFTSSDCLPGSSISATISTAENFNSDALSQWRVISVDKENGIVELMSADPTVQTVTLSGGDGFVNAETVLNNVGEIYGQGKGATGGRSIKLEDVEQYSSFDKTTYPNMYSSTGYYGGTRTFTKGNYYKEEKDGEGNVTGYETTITAASNSSPVTMTQTYFLCSNAQSYFANTTIYNMIFKNSTSTSSKKTNYWLASRCVFLDISNCVFEVDRVTNGDVLSSAGLYDSDGYPYNYTHSVVPVVTLQTNITTTGQDENGVWQLKLD